RDTHAAQLAFPHRCGDCESGHRELHPLGIDMAFGVKVCHHVANVLTARSDLGGELVETDEAAARVGASELAKNVSCEGFAIENVASVERDHRRVSGFEAALRSPGDPQKRRCVYFTIM